MGLIDGCIVLLLKRTLSKQHNRYKIIQYFSYKTIESLKGIFSLDGAAAEKIRICKGIANAMQFNVKYYFKVLLISIQFNY